MTALLCTLMLASPAHAQTPPPTTTLKRVEHYLNSITTLTADFTQISPDGSNAEGKMFLQRPGKMRWQYKPPTPILMVSDGHTLTYFDYELDQISHLPLDDSLAAFLTRPVILLDDDALRIVNFREGAGSIRFTILQTEKTNEGSLTLEFSDKPLKLEGMVMADAAGQITSIKLQNAQAGLPLDASLFAFDDPRKGRRGYRR